MPSLEIQLATTEKAIANLVRYYDHPSPVQMRDLKERVRYLKQRLSVRNSRQARRERTEQAEVHAAALALVEMWRAELRAEPAVPITHTSPPIELS